MEKMQLENSYKASASLRSFARIVFTSADHNIITEYGYFVILEVFCLCESTRGNFTFFLFYLPFISHLFFAMFCQSWAGGCSLRCSPFCCFSGTILLVLLVPPR